MTDFRVPSGIIDLVPEESSEQDVELTGITAEEIIQKPDVSWRAGGRHHPPKRAFAAFLPQENFVDSVRYRTKMV